MKFKDDFITNSSSTAFVVYIPGNLTINDIDIEKMDLQCFNELWECDFGVELEDGPLRIEAKNKMESLINDLKKNPVIDVGRYADDPKYRQMMFFEEAIKDFVIKRIDCGADFCDQVININTKKEKKKLKKLMEETK